MPICRMSQWRRVWRHLREDVARAWRYASYSEPLLMTSVTSQGHHKWAMTSAIISRQRWSLCNVTMDHVILSWCPPIIQQPDVTLMTSLTSWLTSPGGPADVIYKKKGVKSSKIVRFWRFKRLGPLKRTCPVNWNNFGDSIVGNDLI